MINSQTGPSATTLATCWPSQSSHTSAEVEDISSASTSARASLALPIMDLNHDGPPTLIAAMMIVIIPSGAIDRMILSAQPRA
jgi:hypothetical protein